MTGNPLALVLRNEDPDALAIGDLYRKGRSCIADSVRYLLQAGQRLIKKKACLKRGEWMPWLEANAAVLDMDITCTPQRLMNAAGKFGVDAELDDQKAIEISRTIWGYNVRGTGGTGQNEWFTPPEYIALARQVLGEIDLDPAAHEVAQAVIQAKRYFTKTDNGLLREWHGRVWLNPPYSQMKHWVRKMLAERRAGRVTAAIMLTHNYTDTDWFQDAANLADAICFKDGRVKFRKPGGGKAANPTQGQAFFFFGADVLKFASTFRPIGFVYGAINAAASERALDLCGASGE